MEMKPVDPAIVACSPSIRLTRYTREELLALRNSKHSAVTPACLFEPRILQFKIMDQRTENEHIASQLKLFTDRLRQMNINNFDPSLLQLFQNYQRTIINRKFWHPDATKNSNLKKNFQLMRTFQIHLLCNNRYHNVMCLSWSHINRLS